MPKAKIMVALGTVTAVAAASMLGSTSASAAQESDARPALARSTSSLAPDAELAGCKPLYQPESEYLDKTRALDLSDVADGTTVDGAGRLSFAPALDKLSVPESWPTWGSPPDTESAEPDVLYTTSTKIKMAIKRGTNMVGFEVQPAGLGQHQFVAVFSRNGINLCKMQVFASGDAGAKLTAMRSRIRRFDLVTVSTDVDFAIAQVRYRPQHRPH